MVRLTLGMLAKVAQWEMNWSEGSRMLAPLFGAVVGGGWKAGYSLTLEQAGELEPPGGAEFIYSGAGWLTTQGLA